MGRVIYPNTQPILVKLLAWLLHIPNNISTCMMYLMVIRPMLAAPDTNLTISHRFQLLNRLPAPLTHERWWPASCNHLPAYHVSHQTCQEDPNQAP